MCLNSLRFLNNLFIFFGILILLRKNLVKCNPITNSNFNEHIREFSLKEDNISSVNIKTMQKEDPKRYADLPPFIPIRFKAQVIGENITSSPHIPDNLSERKRESVTNEIPDSKASGSSHSRDLVNREHPGYGPNEYEEYPHVSYDYHIPEIDHQQGDHHIDYYGYHKGHHDFGYHHKHYNHALAAKAVLWPLAGIALLGAAAALVGNPILLQLGVATGKRKRRDTEEVSGPDIIEDNWSIPEDVKEHRSKIKRVRPCELLKTKLLKKKNNSTTHSLSKINPTTHSPIDIYAPLSTEYDEMVPVSIKLKDD